MRASARRQRVDPWLVGAQPRMRARTVATQLAGRFADLPHPDGACSAESIGDLQAYLADVEAQTPAVGSTGLTPEAFVGAVRAAAGVLAVERYPRADPQRHQYSRGYAAVRDAAWITLASPRDSEVRAATQAHLEASEKWRPRRCTGRAAWERQVTAMAPDLRAAARRERAALQAFLAEDADDPAPDVRD